MVEFFQHDYSLVNMFLLPDGSSNLKISILLLLSALFARMNQHPTVLALDEASEKQVRTKGQRHWFARGLSCQ